MKRLWHHRRFDLLAVAGFFILPLLLYGAVTLGGRTMLPVDNLFQWAPWAAYAESYDVAVPQNSLLSDLIIQNYAWKQFTRESIAAGEIPLWSPNLFAGSPFLANGQNSTYYPFSILFWLLPLAKAYGWFTLSQLWLAGALAYLFARVLGLRRGSAFLVGLVYQGNGFMLVSAAVFPMIIAAVVWLPLLLAAVERLVQAGLGQGRPGLTFPWLVTGAIGLG
ncbi:MAG: hypothetical protein KDE28_11180, partial [Anaerolineales bacterium]|nr:hypothetical protein [Anaerolineales bacterium]